MAETICRVLRDGCLEGEQAAALTIKDSIDSPFGFDVFTHVLSQLATFIVSGKAQSRGLVLVAVSHSPAYYKRLLKSRGIDVEMSSKWIHILDCYTDPLGWKDQFVENGNFMMLSAEASKCVSICKDVKDVDKLYTSIIGLGRGLVQEGKCRFSVAIDSAAELLRHVSMSLIAGLMSSLRSNDQVSSIFWLVHSDLLETREVAAVEYLSSMVSTSEPLYRSSAEQLGNIQNAYSSELTVKNGKLHVRWKRRNGRVRVMYEEFHIEQSGISFTSTSFDGATSQGLLPKVQFNLQLSEKERIDRANVVLPFEHQGNGKPIQIYDGRRSLEESKNGDLDVGKLNISEEDFGKGEIIYYRDSDDELPDSDEDPDDDLDI